MKQLQREKRKKIEGKYREYVGQKKGVDGVSGRDGAITEKKHKEGENRGERETKRWKKGVGERKKEVLEI